MDKLNVVVMSNVIEKGPEATKGSALLAFIFRGVWFYTPLNTGLTEAVVAIVETFKARWDAYSRPGTHALRVYVHRVVLPGTNQRGPKIRSSLP
eukprot:4698863-Prymnesium_polylepis.1